MSRDELKACLKASGSGTTLQVRLQPRAAREAVVGLMEDRLKIAVTAPPVDSAANKALLRFMARTLGLGRSDVELAVGEKNRNKVLWIRDLSPGETEEKLARAMGLVP